MTASSEPTGNKLTNISALDSINSSITLSESSTTGILSSTNLPTPSNVFPGLTSIFNFGTYENFEVLFGSLKIASERSIPTFSLFMSKAATISISDTL